MAENNQISFRVGSIELKRKWTTLTGEAPGEKAGRKSAILAPVVEAYVRRAEQVGERQAFLEFTTANKTELRNAVDEPNFSRDTRGISGTMPESINKGLVQALEAVKLTALDDPLAAHIIMFNITAALEILAHSKEVQGVSAKELRKRIKIVQRMAPGA